MSYDGILLQAFAGVMGACTLASLAGMVAAAWAGPVGGAARRLMAYGAGYAALTLLVHAYGTIFEGLLASRIFALALAGGAFTLVEGLALLGVKNLWRRKKARPPTGQPPEMDLWTALIIGAALAPAGQPCVPAALSVAHQLAAAGRIAPSLAVTGVALIGTLAGFGVLAVALLALLRRTPLRRRPASTAGGLLVVVSLSVLAGLVL